MIAGTITKHVIIKAYSICFLRLCALFDLMVIALHPFIMRRQH